MIPDKRQRWREYQREKQLEREIPIWESNLRTTTADTYLHKHYGTKLDLLRTEYFELTGVTWDER